MPKQPADDQTQGTLCDFLRAFDGVALDRIPEFLKGRASPVTIDGFEKILREWKQLENACARQYGLDDNLTEIETYTMHNDPRDPGPDETV